MKICCRYEKTQSLKINQWTQWLWLKTGQIITKEVLEKRKNRLKTLIPMQYRAIKMRKGTKRVKKYEGQN